jgi:hypothetical protein
MGAELNSENLNITITSNNSSSQDAYNQLIKLGYLVKEIRFDGEVTDLMILVRDMANQLSDQIANQSDQMILSFLCKKTLGLPMR